MTGLDDPALDQMRSRFERLRSASRRDLNPALSVRLDRLRRLKMMVLEAQDDICGAINADFGHRSQHETRLAEIAALEASIKHAARHVRSWMGPQRMPTRIVYWPGRNRLLAQPLGVCGIISPWNYPLQLALSPAAGAIAAGNVVMLKPSEATPRFSSLLADLVARMFEPDEMSVVTGGQDVGAAFSALPFDHLTFTGSTDVGRKVAAAAGKNLTPVLLELGGKSPVVVDASADVARAAARVAYAKFLNAGQTCIAPDYVLCAAGAADEFTEAYVRAMRRLFGEDPRSTDYSAIISARHRNRLADLVAEARDGGARVRPCFEDQAAFDTQGKFAPCLVQDAKDDMRLMREEIFGPILPVVTFSDAGEAIARINAGERPLALYWFGRDRLALDRVLTGTIAGGVTVNDCLLHYVQEAQPFGGVGASGMGAYHGRFGFETYSKLKPVFHRSAITRTAWLYPPYRKRFARMLALMRALS